MIKRLILVVVDGSGRYEVEASLRLLHTPNYLIFTKENIEQIKKHAQKVY